MSIGISAILYFRKKDVKEHHSLIYRWLLFSIRSLSIFLILFLILGPIIKNSKKHIIKPSVLYIQDNSKSILYAADSNLSKNINTFPSELKKTLIDEFSFKTFTIGKELKPDSLFDFSAQKTDLGNAIKQLNLQYNNDNIGSIILCSDGIINSGENPLYMKMSNNFPIFTIGTGDTSSISDIAIEHTDHNEFSFLNNKFSVHPLIISKNITGKEKIKLFELEDNKEKLIKELTFDIRNGEEKRLDFLINASSIGLRHYRFRVIPNKQDKNHINNEYDFFIEILDDRQQVLLVYDAPHPDISCIKKIIEGQNNIEIKLIKLDELPNTNIELYDLAILYQIPSKNNSAEKLKKLKGKLPLMLFVGNQSDLLEVNKMQKLVKCGDNNHSSNEVGLHLNNRFKLFKIDDDALDFFSNTTPLLSPFSDYINNKGHILFKQKIGNIKTEYPLLIFGNDEVKNCLFIAENLWRWRIHEYLYHESHIFTDELVLKSINYLAQKTDKRKFKIKPLKNLFNEDENVQFKAYLYNESYELIENAEIVLQIAINDSGMKQFDFLNKDDKYFLDIGFLKPGEYKYNSIVRINDKTLKASGVFTVKKNQQEFLNTKANHLLLKQISENSNGKFFDWNNRLLLMDEINKINKQDISFYTFEAFELINKKLIFLFIVLLLSSEWGIRKWLGYI